MNILHIGLDIVCVDDTGLVRNRTEVGVDGHWRFEVLESFIGQIWLCPRGYSPAYDCEHPSRAFPKGDTWTGHGYG